MTGFHRPRREQGIDDHVRDDLRKLTGMDKSFWMWVHLFLGGKEGNYPEPTHPQEWTELYRQCPEMDPGQQYNAEW